MTPIGVSTMKDPMPLMPRFFGDTDPCNCNDPKCMLKPYWTLKFHAAGPQSLDIVWMYHTLMSRS